jgi:1,2-diacylglycerol 3-alpha-glucosyltransferase
MQGPVAVLFDRLGPYHVARIEAAAAAFPTVAVEFGADTADYDWERVDTRNRFERHTVSHGRANDMATRPFARRLFAILDHVRPLVIAVPGWADRGALLALSWAARNGTPVVVMSATHRADATRRPWSERAKKRVIALCSAGLVGGQRQAAYLRELGMPADATFTGYNVVDNGHFERGADAARAAPLQERARLNLPAKFFLASNRFLPKKNLFRLLEAYAAYRRIRGSDAPKLVVLGDGPLKSALVERRATLALVEDVVFPGFAQYRDLPSYYGLAEAFVHASTTEQWGLVVNEAMAAGLPVVVSRACGCAPDLVVNGENGVSFDPYNVDQLTNALSLVSSQPELHARMAKRSRAIISHWSPATFARQLGLARDAALAAQPRSARMIDRTFLATLPILHGLAIRVRKGLDTKLLALSR